MRAFHLWLLAVAAAILAAVAVPYGLLADAGGSLAVFVFWCGFGAAVVVLIALGAARWKV